MLPAGSHPVSKFKLAAFGLITCSLFFVLVEGVLAVLDIPKEDVSQDPFVGFSSQENLFTETLVEQNGKTIPVMVTHPDKLELFPNESFARAKPKRTLRAFCLGGSTTYGRPYTPRTSFCSWVEDFINQADGSRRWEVINAGGVSYASYRIALLMKELIQYEPDLFIVYTGHNEFLEQRTYSKILRLPMVLRDIGTLASRLRIYALLDQWIAGGATEEGKSPPVHALAEEVTPILDHSVGPESYQRDDEQKQNIVAHFRYNLARIIKLARSVGAKTILVAPASKLRHETPFKSQHRAGLVEPELTKWKESYESAEHLARQKKFEAALSQIRAAEALDPRYAHTFSLKGDILYGLGRYPEAKAAYQRAVDEDICPLRAITPLHTSVMEIGRRMKVPVVDFEPMVSALSPHGITDEKMFLDHVHPTIEGHRILALRLVNEIDKIGLIESPRPVKEDDIRRIVKARMAHVDHEAQAEALMERAMLANWGGKFQEAITLAERAVDIDSDYVDRYYWFKWVRSYDIDVDFNAESAPSGKNMESKVEYLLAKKSDAENDPFLENAKVRLEILGRYDVVKPPPERVERAAE